MQKLLVLLIAFSFTSIINIQSGFTQCQNQIDRTNKYYPGAKATANVDVLDNTPEYRFFQSKIAPGEKQDTLYPDECFEKLDSRIVGQVIVFWLIRYKRRNQFFQGWIEIGLISVNRGIKEITANRNIRIYASDYLDDSYQWNLAGESQ